MIFGKEAFLCISQMSLLNETKPKGEAELSEIDGEARITDDYVGRKVAELN